MSKDSSLDRILSALNHPIRRRIMRELVEGPASASMLSRSFGMDLGVVSYHLNKVLAQQCEVVELVESVPRRGSMEKIYRLKSEFPQDLPAAGQSGSSDEFFWTLSLGESLFKAVKSAKG